MRRRPREILICKQPWAMTAVIQRQYNGPPRGAEVRSSISVFCQGKGMWRLRAAFLLTVATGCVATSRRPETSRATAPAVGPPAGVVFVANGAGDFRALSQNLATVLTETGAPLQIKTVEWSLGYRRYVADQVDHANHLVQGRRLAAEVTAYRANYPERRIYLLGHSAGCAVLLIAAESLPPDSLDRMILLAPSVCENYDLRPALRACRCGIDAYHSSRDRWILGLGVRIVGTTEGSCRSAAGLHGFAPVMANSQDAALYARLRQHPWDPVVEWTGHDGGHFGGNQTAFLRAYVLPLLSGN